MKKHFLPALVFFSLVTSCGNNEANTSEKADDTKAAQPSAAPDIRDESVRYGSDTVTYNGFLAYDENREGRRPVVLVVHEWWGLNDYAKDRARQLAEMGYLAMAVDMYGNGKQAGNPEEAMALATPFYQSPELARSRLELALAKIKADPRADTSKTAAIGYCYGGYVVLNAAKLGSNLDGVVSFHGGLGGAPATKGMKAKVLVCHGEADNFVPKEEIDGFRKTMAAAGADYDFKVYPGATHAFTNPDATETGKKFKMPIQYNGAADTASWNDMKAFLNTVLK